MMNRQGLTVVREFDPAPITTLLCDADDNLFPSERPAFAASTDVTNRFLARFGVTAPLSFLVGVPHRPLHLLHESASHRPSSVRS